MTDEKIKVCSECGSNGYLDANVGGEYHLIPCHVCSQNKELHPAGTRAKIEAQAAELDTLRDVLAYFVAHWPAGAEKKGEQNVKDFDDMFQRGMELTGMWPFTADTESKHAPETCSTCGASGCDLANGICQECAMHKAYVDGEKARGPDGLTVLSARDAAHDPNVG